MGFQNVSSQQHSVNSRKGAIKSWERTPDRSMRTKAARINSPSNIDYWLPRLGPEFDGASEQQRRKAARKARSEHFRAMAHKAVEARRAKREADESGGER